jgi:cold shock CspA family protein
MVNNKPLAPAVAGRTAPLGAAVEGTLLSNAEFGFEMRPVAAGEGANGFDPTYVVSGLWHDARRRSNLILRETTGNQTVVRLQAFDQAGLPVLKDGRAVDFEVAVPALGSLQINDADLFPAEAITGGLWVRVEFRQGVVDPFGNNRGAVVPFATVIDSGTQDASLRVGVSTKALVPATPETSPTLRALGSGLPFDGGPELLMMPVSHVTGAALASGVPPRWRTRVTLSNVSETEQRNVRLTLKDKSGKLPQGTLLQTSVVVPPGWGITFDDILEELFGLPAEAGVWGTVEADNLKRSDGTWLFTWTDVDVQTETYTADTQNAARGEFRTGMEGYSYRHGYSSFQSNLGTVLIDGAETSPRNRTNLILQEVGGAACTLAVAVYQPGALVPVAMTNVALKPFDYVSRELFRDLMQLDLEEVVDARVVVRQVDGDGVFMAFVSKINLVTGDPANVFLRPASAGTGR